LTEKSRKEIQKGTSRRKFIAAAGAAAVVVAAGAGYYMTQPGPTPTPTTTATETLPATTTAPPTSTGPKRGGTLFMQHRVQARNLDPRIATSIDCFYVNLWTFDSLVRYAGGIEKRDVTIVPHLAESYEKLDDRTYEFRLHKGVKFHDGTELKASDVKYTFDCFLNVAEWNKKFVVPHSAFYVGYYDPEKTKVIDDYTIQLGSTKDFPNYGPFLWDLPRVSIVSERASEEMGANYNLTPIGSGPFKFVKWEEPLIVLRRNENYWVKDAAGNQLPYTDELQYLTIPDAATAEVRLLTGHEDITLGVPFKDIADIADTEGFKGLSKPSWETCHLQINHSKPYLANKYLRKALLYAMNRQAIIDTVYRGHAQMGNPGYIPSWHWAYNPEVTPFPYDPEMAKNLLAEGGYPDGFELELQCNDVYPWLDAATMVQQDWAKVGIKARLRPGEEEASYASVFDGTFDTFLTRFNGGLATYDPHGIHFKWLYGQMPEGFLTEDLKKKFGRLWPHGMWWNLWSGPEAQRAWKLIDDAARTDVIEDRKKIYGELQKIIAEECVSMQVLALANQLTAMGDYVQGFDQDFGGRIYLEKVWLAK
jgi:peptide/nickel transport system substrate-binding protein